MTLEAKRTLVTVTQGDALRLNSVAIVWPGPGHHCFTAATEVQTPLETPFINRQRGESVQHSPRSCLRAGPRAMRSPIPVRSVRGSAGGGGRGRAPGLR